MKADVSSRFTFCQLIAKVLSVSSVHGQPPYAVTCRGQRLACLAYEPSQRPAGLEGLHD